MAASKSYRFLCSDREPPSIASDSVYELDESDVWNSGISSSPEFRKPMASSRKKPSVRRGTEAGGAASSLPVNVPDWSKILKEEYKESRRTDSDDDDFDNGDGGNRIPPHEFLARQLARTRIASFSVHEGVGRTLKGRDLSRMRNAIFEKTGFQD